MKLYNSNPYRILGIKANASAPEKQKVKARIAAYIKVGKAPVLDFDLTPPLKAIERTQELIDLKSNEILSDEDKVKHALFWFVSGGTIDDIALSNLTESKNLDKALSNFEKGSKGFAISKSSICSIINHSTLEIICYPEHKDKTRLKTAINRKLDIVCSDSHLSLVLSFLNPNHSTISSNTVSSYVTDSLKDLLSELFKSQKEEDLFIEFFAGQKEIISEFKRGKNEKTIRGIKTLTADTKNRREKLLDSYTSAYDDSSSQLLKNGSLLGQKLIQSSKDLLFQIKNDNGKNHASTTMIFESVMEELNYCAVLPFNAVLDKVNNSSDSKARTIVQSLSTSDFDHLISMTENAVLEFGDVNTTVLDTMKQNIEGYIETKKQLNSNSEGSGWSIGNIFNLIFWVIVILSWIGRCS